MKKLSFSVVIPAKNEVRSIGTLIEELVTRFPQAEIIVVNDGSDDDTAVIAESLGAVVVSHPTSRGNGAAIKTGVRAARGDLIVCMDADGQHSAEHIPPLLEKLEQGYDLAVAARSASDQASWARRLANRLYNVLASWMTGHEVKDLTSGFRAMKRQHMMEFLSLLPNGFSYPTTSTMAFYRAGYGVVFVPTPVGKRVGASHIRPLQDGFRFLLIIFRVATLYSPLKLFVPISFGLAASGVGYYALTYLTAGRFTNFGALLLSTACLTFLIGLVSEQITQLTFLASGSKAKSASSDS